MLTTAAVGALLRPHYSVYVSHNPREVERRACGDASIGFMRIRYAIDHSTYHAYRLLARSAS